MPIVRDTFGEQTTLSGAAGELMKLGFDSLARRLRAGACARGAIAHPDATFSAEISAGLRDGLRAREVAPELLWHADPWSSSLSWTGLAPCPRGSGHESGRVGGGGPGQSLRGEGFGGAEGSLHRPGPLRRSHEDEVSTTTATIDVPSGFAVGDGTQMHLFRHACPKAWREADAACLPQVCLGQVVQLQGEIPSSSTGMRVTKKSFSNGVIKHIDSDGDFRMGVWTPLMVADLFQERGDFWFFKEHFIGNARSAARPVAATPPTDVGDAVSSRHRWFLGYASFSWAFCGMAQRSDATGEFLARPTSVSSASSPLDVAGDSCDDHLCRRQAGGRLTCHTVRLGSRGISPVPKAHVAARRFGRLVAEDNPGVSFRVCVCVCLPGLYGFTRRLCPRRRRNTASCLPSLGSLLLSSRGIPQLLLERSEEQRRIGMVDLELALAREREARVCVYMCVQAHSSLVRLRMHNCVH